MKIRSNLFTNKSIVIEDIELDFQLYFGYNGLNNRDTRPVGIVGVDEI